jgi:iron-sulfur cluster repair protein YtfE (RIC family)
MLTRIGRPAIATDSVALVLECHDRIRGFLALAGRIAQALPGDVGLAEAAARVHAYFTQALPLHARDEEDSILPRLRGRDRAVDEALEAMAREHAEHGPLVGALVDACGGLAREPGRHPELASVIGAAAAALEQHFEVHLGREEEVVVPAMRRYLDASVDREVVREIRARRGVVDTTVEEHRAL